MWLHPGAVRTPSESLHWKLTESWLWENNKPLSHRELNLRQYCAWLFSPTLYQLSYRGPGFPSVVLVSWSVSLSNVSFCLSVCWFVCLFVMLSVWYSWCVCLLCQKCMWQVSAQHAYTLRVWLCMKWRDIVHGCMVYTERAETAAVSRGTSHVTTKQRCKYITSMDIVIKRSIKS